MIGLGVMERVVVFQFYLVGILLQKKVQFILILKDDICLDQKQII